MILHSTTRSAHKCVQGFVENGEDIDTIFHQLVVMYDVSLTPEQGRIKLHSFKASKDDTLDKIISEILELATISSKLYPIGSVRSNHVNVTASMALIQSLPDQGVLKYYWEVSPRTVSVNWLYVCIKKKLMRA